MLADDFIQGARISSLGSNDWPNTGCRRHSVKLQGIKNVPSRKTQQSTESLTHGSTKASTEIRGIPTKYWSFLHSKFLSDFQVGIILLLQLSACVEGGDDPNAT
jgi:hypothetical protein